MERRTFLLIRKVNHFDSYPIGKSFVENLRRNEVLLQWNIIIIIIKTLPGIQNNRYNPVIRLKSFVYTSYVQKNPWVLSALLRSKRLVHLLELLVDGFYFGHFMAIATRYSFWECSGKENFFQQRNYTTFIDSL